MRWLSRIKRGMLITGCFLVVCTVVYVDGLIRSLQMTQTFTTSRGDVFAYLSVNHTPPAIVMPDSYNYLAIYNGKRFLQRPFFTWDFESGFRNTPSFYLVYEDAEVRIYSITLDHEDDPGYAWKHLPSGRAGYFECYDEATIRKAWHTAFLRPFLRRMRQELSRISGNTNPSGENP